MADLDAHLGIEVERPLVPGGRRAVNAEPSQLIEPLHAIAKGGSVTFIAAEIGCIEYADGKQPPVVLDEAPARACPACLGVLRHRAIVVDPDINLARFVLVAELKQSLAAGADLQRPVLALAGFGRVYGHVARDRPAFQSIVAVKGYFPGFFAGLRKADSAHSNKTEPQRSHQHGLLLSA